MKGECMGLERTYLGEEGWVYWRRIFRWLSWRNGRRLHVFRGMEERALATESFPSGVIRIAEAAAKLHSNRYGNIFMGSRRTDRLGGRPDQTVHHRRRRRIYGGRTTTTADIWRPTSPGWRWRTQSSASLAIHYWVIFAFQIQGPSVCLSVFHIYFHEVPSVWGYFHTSPIICYWDAVQRRYINDDLYRR